MMSFSSIAHLITIGACMSVANNVSARPIEMLEPIWCLSESQKTSLMENLQPIMKQAATIEFSLLTMRKLLYLSLERELHLAQGRLETCLTKSQLNCDQSGVKRLERDIQGLNELDAKPLSDSDSKQRSVIMEKMRTVRSEYPLCK